jgi:hypothetical protein
MVVSSHILTAPPPPPLLLLPDAAAAALEEGGHTFTRLFASMPSPTPQVDHNRTNVRKSFI